MNTASICLALDRSRNDPTPVTLSPGSRVGPYDITAPLGEGGMGAVYRARDPRLHRDVAVKVLRAEMMQDPDRRARFLQEAQAVSALNHPNIVTIHDIGTEGDVVYMVMELVDGEPLDRLIPPGGMRLAEVLHIGAQVAEACARAHATGIVHRDLKPANVMRQPDGRVKVLDFGLAKQMDPAGADAGRTLATQTAEGTLLGTAAYMSPEQAEGKPLDARSDIFSLGSVLYELATGQRPFRGDSQMAILADVLRQEPTPPGDLRADLPAEFDRLILRCLRKDPARRVQSMADLQVALEELRADTASGRALSGRIPSGSIPRAAQAPTRRVSPATAAAALAVVAAIIAAGFFLWRGRTATAPSDTTLQAVPFTSYPGLEHAGAFSPDGNQVVFWWNGEAQDNYDIYVKLVGPGPPLRLTSDPRVDLFPRWSPDGRQIAFVRFLDDPKRPAPDANASHTVSIMVIPSLGGTERKVVDLESRIVLNSSLSTVSWTADSQSLIVSGGRVAGESNSLYRVPVDTGELIPLAAADPSAGGYTEQVPSPDGTTLAAVHLDASGSRTVQLFDMNPDGTISGSRTLTAIASPVGSIGWTGDSKSLVFSVSVNNPLPLYRMALDEGPATPMAWTGPGASNPVVARNGGRLMFSRSSRDTNIWQVTLDDSGRKSLTTSQLASSSFREVFPHYSPDGRRLVFYSNRGGSVQIWMAEADGSRAVQVTSMDPMATSGSPRWSPDSRRIVFDSNAGGGYHIYEIDADGGQPRALTSGASSNVIGSWSPDGQWLYFTSNRGGQLDVWRVSANGGEPQQVTRGGGQAPTVSHDGRWTYFTKQDGGAGLWRMPAEGGAEERVLAALYRYNYVPTATGVYFVAPPDAAARSSVRFLDFATGRETEIIEVNRPDLGLALSPDGRHLLYTAVDYLGTDLMLVENFR